MIDTTKGKNYMSMGQLLEFETAFPGETALTPEMYLKGGNREVILRVATFFLGFKSFNSKYNDNKEVLKAIFGAENIAFANEIYDKIKVIEKSGRKLSIIHVHSSLTLFEYFFEKEGEKETQTHAEFEINLFKAYLVINSEFTKKQYVASLSTENLHKELKIAMYLFCMSYPVSDKTNYDIIQIWIAQLIKATYLFQFLESNENTKPLLTAFLTYFNCASWQEYLKFLLPLTIPAITNETEEPTDIIITPGANFERACIFIEKLIVLDNDEFDKNDFLTLRAKPFYKIKDGVYRIIFSLFVVEKIFKGVYFLLRDVNKLLPEGIQLQSLKGIYGHAFSEKTLVYKILEIIYSNKCVRFSGDKLSEMKLDGAPDYYIRNGKDILLFESKDFLIRADKKMSFDFNIYDEEFSKTLYFEELPNGKEKAGAVMQIITNIRRILKKEFNADEKYDYKYVFIYPILLTHDHQYDSPGFNLFINNWLKDELEILEQEGLFIHHVNPLVVVNVDSIIYHQVGLSETIQLHEVLKAYITHIRINPMIKFKTTAEAIQYFMNKLIPFSLFIDRLFKNRGIVKQPPIVDLVAPSLFKDEYEKRNSSKSSS